jgi:hypothetical protein
MAKITSQSRAGSNIIFAVGEGVFAHLPPAADGRSPLLLLGAGDRCAEPICRLDIVDPRDQQHVTNLIHYAFPHNVLDLLH